MHSCCLFSICAQFYHGFFEVTVHLGWTRGGCGGQGTGVYLYSAVMQHYQSFRGGCYLAVHVSALPVARVYITGEIFTLPEKVGTLTLAERHSCILKPANFSAGSF